MVSLGTPTPPSRVQNLFQAAIDQCLQLPRHVAYDHVSTPNSQLLSKKAHPHAPGAATAVPSDSPNSPARPANPSPCANTPHPHSPVTLQDLLIYLIRLGQAP